MNEEGNQTVSEEGNVRRSKVGRALFLLWVCRVPLGALLVLVGMGVLVWPAPIPILLSEVEGLGPWAALLSGGAAVLAASLFAQNLIIILEGSHERFGVESFWQGFLNSRRTGRFGAVVALAGCSWLVLALALRSDHFFRVLAGAALAALAVYGTVKFLFFAKDRKETHPEAGLGRLAQFAEERLDAFFARFGPGYREELLSGHSIALALFVLVFLLVWLVGRFFSVSDHSYGLEEHSALLYLLLWLSLVTSLLSGVAYFFDRYRVPLLLLLLVGAGLIDLAAAWVAKPLVGWERKHVFQFSALPASVPTLECGFVKVMAGAADGECLPAAESAGAPREGLAPAAPEAAGGLPVPPRRLLVSAEGGGIRAAVWAAEVLSRLEEAASAAGAPAVSERLRMLSATSGGAVGSSFYLAGVAPRVGVERLSSQLEGTLAAQMKRVREQAFAPSLEATSWGLLYRDWLRLARRPREDRGWAMERAWEDRMREIVHGCRSAEGIEQRVRKQCEEAAERFEPLLLSELTEVAVVLNSTEAETGLPVWLSNAVLPESKPYSLTPQEKAARSALRFDRDLRLGTAARLSATFPVVSPSPRPNERLDGDLARSSHLVDGGYFDNSGDQAVLTALRRHRERGLGGEFTWLRIRDPECESSSDDFFGAAARWLLPDTLELPGKAILGVRSSSQRIRGELAAGLFGDGLGTADSSGAQSSAAEASDEGGQSEPTASAAPAPLALTVYTVSPVFEPKTREERKECPPLSWGLTEAQRDTLVDAAETTVQCLAVAGFHSGKAGGLGPGCEGAPLGVEVLRLPPVNGGGAG